MKGDSMRTKKIDNIEPHNWAIYHEKVLTRQPLYFDQLKLGLQNTVKDWLTDNFDAYEEPEAFECRSRDGYIPHYWNKGGLRIYNRRSLSEFQFGDNPISLETDVETKVNDYIIADQKAVLEFFKDQYAKELKSIPDKKISYDGLDKLGKHDLAYKLSEMQDDSLNEDENSTFHEVRVMFDGFKKFTVDVMFRFSDAPYHRTCDQCKTYTIETLDIRKLRKFLKSITKEVIDYYGN